MIDALWRYTRATAFSGDDWEAFCEVARRMRSEKQPVAV